MFHVPAPPATSRVTVSGTPCSKLLVLNTLVFLRRGKSARGRRIFMGLKLDHKLLSVFFRIIRVFMICFGGLT